LYPVEPLTLREIRALIASLEKASGGSQSVDLYVKRVPSATTSGT